MTKIVLAATLASAAAWATPERKPNVLFLSIDDLRPELGCYGAPTMHTPHLDALAARGTVFERAYCQQAVCAPSRASLLTGRRPDSTRVYDLDTHFRAALPDVITLPQHFRQHGYSAHALGKIFHGGLDDARSWDSSREVDSFGHHSREIPVEHRHDFGRAEDPAHEKNKERGPSWISTDLPDEDLIDGKIATAAIERLRAFAALPDRPFFLAIGFTKPHLPFHAPQRYYALYPLEATAPPAQSAPPIDAPELAFANWNELRRYLDIPPQGALSEIKARELIRAYRTATSFADAQIGRVLAALHELGLAENTIVVVWGDHGWHLGDQGQWAKHTNFETAVRSPLIIAAPGQPAGIRTRALVEFVDVFPTLCDLACLPSPAGLEGVSAAPLFKDPDRAWKSAAFSQYPRRGHMGYSLCTERWRYTAWLPRETPGAAPAATELYDLARPGGESRNLAHQPEHAELVADLDRQLRAGWRAALPTPIPPP